MIKSMHNNKNISNQKSNIYFQKKCTIVTREICVRTCLSFNYYITQLYRFVREAIVNAYSTK